MDCISFFSKVAKRWQTTEKGVLIDLRGSGLTEGEEMAA
jgi:hypothetical protein